MVKTLGETFVSGEAREQFYILILSCWPVILMLRHIHMLWISITENESNQDTHKVLPIADTFQPATLVELVAGEWRCVFSCRIIWLLSFSAFSSKFDSSTFATQVLDATQIMLTRPGPLPLWPDPSPRLARAETTLPALTRHTMLPDTTRIKRLIFYTWPDLAPVTMSTPILVTRPDLFHTTRPTRPNWSSLWPDLTWPYRSNYHILV